MKKLSSTEKIILFATFMLVFCTVILLVVKVIKNNKNNHLTAALVPINSEHKTNLPESEEANSGIVLSEQDTSNETNATKKSEKSLDPEKIERLIAMYDYDTALAEIADSKEANTAIGEQYKKQIEEIKAALVPADPYPTHIFFHSLIADTDLAFDGDYKADGYNQYMTTITEFNKMLEEMHQRGFVLISIKDLVRREKDENGNDVFVQNEILLPQGKKPLILSVDDVNYYEYMEADGFAKKLTLDDQGKVVNEYVTQEGFTKYGAYDVAPLLDQFVEEHPDFSYQGAKGILAVTGYEGVLGYRTDSSYQQENPNFEEDKAMAKKVADALKADGWEFASHSWGHIPMAVTPLENIIEDTQNFLENVIPIIGETNILIYAHGSDIAVGVDPYAADNDKFQYLHSVGFEFFCPVDSISNWTVYAADHVRQGRKNLDGYRMYYNPELVDDLFDVEDILDPARPLPVPPI